MALVRFSSQIPSFKFSGSRKTAKWLESIAKKEGRSLESLNYVFCTDAFLGDLNKKYLAHSTLTDILTFDLSEDEKIAGEVYISIPRVKENAIQFQEPFEVELRRVIVHGLLHLIGFKDKTASEKAIMRSKERACLSLWK